MSWMIRSHAPAGGEAGARIPGPSGGRVRALQAAFLIAVLGPFLPAWIHHRDAGFTGRISVSSTRPPPPPDPDELDPGLLREEYHPDRGLLATAPRVDPRIHFDFSGRRHFSDVHLRWSGWIRIDRAGLHGFELCSDDGSQLLVDGTTVVRNWGAHGPLVRSGRIHLDPGLHALEVRYFQVDGEAQIRLAWQPPGERVTTVPPGVLFHRRRFDPAAPATRLLPAPAGGPAGTLQPGWLICDFRHSMSGESLLDAFVSAKAGIELPAQGTGARLMMGWIRPDGPGPARLEAVLEGPGIVEIDGHPAAGRPGEPVEGRVELALEPAGRPLLVRVYLGGGERRAPRARIEVAGGAVEASPADLGPLDPFSSLVVEETLEVRHQPHLGFHDPVPLLTPFFHRWRVDRLGPPASWPTASGSWTGDLHAPAPGLFRVQVRSTGPCRITLGSRSFLKGAWPQAFQAALEVPGGWTPIQVEWFDSGYDRALEVTGGLGIEPLVPLGRRAVHPRPTDGRLPALTATVVLLLVVIVLVALGGGPAAQLEVLRRSWGPLVGVIVIVAGLALRLAGYEERPFPGNVEDEANHHILGHSLLKGDLPIGWDFRDHYTRIVPVPFHGRVYKMAVPFVFYPPVFSSLVSLLSTAAGYPRVFETPLHVTRLLPIALSVLTLALLWPLGAKLGLGPVATLLGMAHFAVMPFFVMNHRLVKEENLVALLYVVLVLALVDGRRAPGPIRRHLVGSLIVVGLLTKQMAIAFPALAVIHWGTHRHGRAALLAFLYGVLGIGLFVLFGCMIDPESFWKTQQVLTRHGLGLDALEPLITGARIVDREGVPNLVAGTFLLAFITLGTRRRASILPPAVLLYLVAILLSYSAQRNYGWYRLPLFPLLSLCWGVQAHETCRKLDPTRVLLLVGFFLLPALHGLTPPGPFWDKTILRTLVLLFLVPSFGARFLPGRAAGPVRAAAGSLLLACCLLAMAGIVLDWERIDPYAWPGDPGGTLHLPLEGPGAPAAGITGETILEVPPIVTPPDPFAIMAPR